MKNKFVCRKILYWFFYASITISCFDGAVFSDEYTLAPRSSMSEREITGGKRENEEDLLNLSNYPELASVWNKQVSTHLKLFEFAVNMARLTANYGAFVNFPAHEVEHLFSIFDFSEIDWEKNPKLMRYMLGFISYNRMNSKIFDENMSDDIYFSMNYELNLVMTSAFVSSKIKFNELDMTKLYRFAGNEKFYPNSILQPLFLKSPVDYFITQLESLFKYSMKTQRNISEEKKDKFFEYAKKVLSEWAKDLLVPFHEISGHKYWGEYLNTKISVLPEYKDLLPNELWEKGPEEYFATLPEIERTSEEMKFFKLREMFGQTSLLNHPGIILPGDRIFKIMTIGDDFYVKRIDIMRSRYPEEPIVLANKVEEILKEKDPAYNAMEFVGIIYDKGNFYLISKKAPGKAYNRLWGDDFDYFERNFMPDVLQTLKSLGIEDSEGSHLRERECIIGFKNGKLTITIVDYETFPFMHFEDVELQDKELLLKAIKKKHAPVVSIVLPTSNTARRLVDKGA